MVNSWGTSYRQSRPNSLREQKVEYRLALNGILAGLIATVALEIFRESGFRLGAMPGDLPRLMGVLILNQFSSGPDTLSDLAGWSYHFWNGASFGLIYSLLLGQGKLWQGFLYGLLIGVGFMISPVAKSLGIGLWGLDFKDGYQFALTVILAHVAFGLTLSFLLMRWNKGMLNICVRWRHHTCNSQDHFLNSRDYALRQWGTVLYHFSL